MIGTIRIKVAAHSPNLPLQPIFAFVDSPISIRIVDLPKRIGQWHITKAYLQITYPDDTERCVECLPVGGCHVATVEGSTRVGDTLNGYAVRADGVDENGNPVTGYTLGRGDVFILDADTCISANQRSCCLRLWEYEPQEPKRGDVLCEDSGLAFYTGENWRHCPDAQISDYYTKVEADARYLPLSGGTVRGLSVGSADSPLVMAKADFVGGGNITLRTVRDQVGTWTTTYRQGAIVRDIAAVDETGRYVIDLPHKSGTLAVDADLSAYQPKGDYVTVADLSAYYTKGETLSREESISALSAKADKVKTIYETYTALRVDDSVVGDTRACD